MKKTRVKGKFKGLAIGLSVVTFVNTTIPSTFVYANEVDIPSLVEKVEAEMKTSVMKPFTIGNHVDFVKYQEEFQVPKESIGKVTAKGGYNSSSTPEKAVDGNINTHWETRIKNTDDYKNEFIVEFKENVSINKLTYKIRTSMTGFLNEYEIYGSKSSDGNDFELMTKGTGETTKDTVEINFEETEVKRVKIVFLEALRDWPSISELNFYKADPVTDKMNGLFTDESMSQVQEYYQDVNRLNELEEAAKGHPFYDEYLSRIHNAKALLEEYEVKSSIAEVGLFKYLDNDAYNEAFKMDASNIKSIKNNAGHYSDKVIGNAIDGDISTYWETNKANSDSFTNEVEIEFRDKVELDKVVFGARPQDGKGFAENFEIYASNTSEGDTYQLVTEGTYKTVKNLVEVAFEPTMFKRIKFVYKGSSQNWATATEFWLYKEDKLTKEVATVFEDSLHTVLSPNYDTVDEITELENKVNLHPLRSDLIQIVNQAKALINGNEVEKSEIITLTQRGDENEEKARTGQRYAGSNFDLTGYYVMPGESIDVYVDGREGDVLPQLVFTQVGDVDALNPSNNAKPNYRIDLKVGRNVITAPAPVEATKPFAIYFSNRAFPSEQGYAPKVRLQSENLKKYPIYIHGETDPQEYIEEVKNHTGANMTDVTGDRFLVSTLNTEAQIAYVQNGNSPLDVVREMENLISIYDKISGLDEKDENPLHRPSTGLYTIKLTNGTGSFACNEYVHWSSREGNKFLSGQIYGWGFVHEFGHQIENGKMILPEVTNNIYSLTTQLLQGYPMDGYDVKQEVIDQYLLTGEANYNELTYSEKLMFIYQIINYFGIEAYSDAYRLVRENPQRYQTEGTRQVLINAMSEATGYDLASHFELYQYPVSEDTKAFTSQFKKLDKHIHYTTVQGQDMLKDSVETFTSKTKAIVKDIKRESDGFTLTLGTNDQNKGTILYEIYRDGELVGLSRKGTYKDVVDTKEAYMYQAIAYDYRVNESVKSDGVSSDIGFKPYFKNEEHIQIPLHTEFNPKDYVKAFNYAGEDISDKIVFTQNVDGSKRGTYTIPCEVTDHEFTTKNQFEIEVVSSVEYASDLSWVRATSGWSSPAKDKAVGSANKIKLSIDGQVKEFTKGLSAAANSEFVYNLEGKEYEYFTAYVGTDKNYNKTQTSFTFKVLADGKEVYQSKLMKSNSDAEYIHIPVKGVKELKLVADDYGNGITGDFASWADATFYTTNTKPTIKVDGIKSTKVGEPIENIAGTFTAVDIEDGDLTSKVVVDVPKNINYNKPGEYKITYTVTDSDQNMAKLERTFAVVDMRDATYITDYDWKSAVQSYSTTKKDMSQSGNKLRLTDENGKEVIYERGIGSHANATIIYDLSDKNYEYFTSFVGVDRYQYNTGSSITFEVYVDGVKKFDSGLMTGKMPQKYVEVDINGGKELKLVVTDGGNGIGYDHASWGNGKLHFVNGDRADVTSLKEQIKNAEAIDYNQYTEESVNSLKEAIQAAKELLNTSFVSQTASDEAVKNIETALNKLAYKVITIEDEFLEKDIRRTLGIQTGSITIADMQKLTTLTCDTGYVRTLNGLEYAMNLESLNIDYNEVTDLSAIGKLMNLKNFSGEENFILTKREQLVFENGKYIFDDVVIDRDGKRMVPKGVVLSPRVNPVKLELKDVLHGNKIIIDKSIIGTNMSVEILYENEDKSYQLYMFTLFPNS